MPLADDLISLPRESYGEHYEDHVLEIYKLYVESADNISARRQSANSFFLTVNTAIIGAVGYLNDGSNSLAWAISIAGILICISWHRSVQAYKGLNSGKFKVIHELEKKLPVSVYGAEWQAVGRGENPKLYLPFTKIEIWIPRIFMTLHGVMTVSTIPWHELCNRLL